MNEKTIFWIRAAIAAIAAMVSPAIPGLLVGIPDLIGGDHVFWWYVFPFYFFGILGLLIFGAPLFFVMVKKKISLGFWVCSLVGALSGLGVFLLFVVGPMLFQAPSVDSSLLFVFGLSPVAMIAEFISGMVFWLISRPEKYFNQQTAL